MEKTFRAFICGALVREDEYVLVRHLHVPLLLHLRVQHVPPAQRFLIGPPQLWRGSAIGQLGVRRVTAKFHT
jgi:hypothetical protein